MGTRLGSESAHVATWALSPLLRSAFAAALALLPVAIYKLGVAVNAPLAESMRPSRCASIAVRKHWCGAPRVREAIRSLASRRYLRSALRFSDRNQLRFSLTFLSVPLALLLTSLLSIALTTACVPPPRLNPQTAPILHVGLNAWPYELTPTYLQKFVALGANTVRVPVTSRQQAQDVLAAVEGSPLSVLLLVEKPDLDLVAALADMRHPQLVALELGNEIELTGVSASDYVRFELAGFRLLADARWSVSVITGGLYTVDSGTLAYAAPALAQTPCSVVFGVHLYGDSSDDVLAQLQAAAGCHQIAVTEFGQPSRTPVEDAAQVAYLQEKLVAFQRVGAQFALIYQCCSGPSASNLDNFGLLRTDLTLKGFTFP